MTSCPHFNWRIHGERDMPLLFLFWKLHCMVCFFKVFVIQKIIRCIIAGVGLCTIFCSLLGVELDKYTYDWFCVPSWELMQIERVSYFCFMLLFLAVLNAIRQETIQYSYCMNSLETTSVTGKWTLYITFTCIKLPFLCVHTCAATSHRLTGCSA